VAAVAQGVAPAFERRKLRVGVFADAPLQPRWIVDALERVARSDFAEIVALDVGESAPQEPLFWRLYHRLDRLAFGDDAAQPTPIPHWGQGTFPVPDPGLDVAFVLGAVEEDKLIGRARYGVWRFCFGNERAHAESLAGWREVTQGTPLTGSGIKVRLCAERPARLAYQSWSRTYPLSVARNRAQLLRKTSEFAWRALRELHRGGAQWLEQCPPVQERVLGLPTARELLQGAAGIGSRIVQRGVQKALGLEQWFLAWRFGEAQAIAADLAGYTRAVPPPDRDWADPFVIAKHDRYFVFFEELPYKAAKAHIAMIEVRRDGWLPPTRVLERSHHLSYPFLVEEEGELYMIPESAQNNTVDLYRCVDFPGGWKHERTLIDGVRLVDATLYRAPERWWLFANAAAEGSRVFDDELHLYYADQLRGPWRGHRANPVKSDVRGARPAGRLYRRGGVLHRPAQICVPRYGAGLAIHRVLRLSPERFVERQVRRVLPAGGLLGLHTLNRAGELTVVDAFARRSRFS
jgi:hypothetical protein